MCKYVIKQVASDTDYLNNIITTNEMWNYCYNPAFKQQMSEWVLRDSFHPLKPSTKKSKMKCIVITFFNQEGLVYTHDVPDGYQTVSADWYIKVLRWLITLNISCKQPHYCNG